MKRLIFLAIVVLAFSQTSYATTMYPISQPYQQFFDANGIPLSGGFVYTCQPGTTCTSSSMPSPKATYTDSTGTSANTNPIVLDSAGRASFWGTGFYKFSIYDSSSNLIKTQDNVPITFNYVTPVTLPWVDASAYASLNAAITAIGSTTTTLVIKSANFPMTGAAVIPATLAVNMQFPGSIANSTYALTINGPFSAGNYQVFTGSGAVAGLKEVYPDWFGANTSPGTTDMTAAITSAAACAKGSNGVLHFGPGPYAATKITLLDFQDVTLRFDGTTIYGIASSATNALLEIDNAVRLELIGSVYFKGESPSGTVNTNYTSGMVITTKDNSALNATPNPGVLTRVHIYNPKFKSFTQAISIGDYNRDSQDSELTIFGAEMFLCPGAVYAAGSQTVAAFVGGSIVSEPNAGLSGANEFIVKTEGAHVMITGAEAVLAAGSGSSVGAFQVNPGSSVTYVNPYGSLRLGNTHVETGGTPMLHISNPRSLTTPSSWQSGITFDGAHGYAGANLTGTLITIADTTYTGPINIPDGNHFYLPPSAGNRTGLTIDDTGGLARLIIGKTAFDTGFLDWMGGVKGGNLIHPLMLVGFIDNLAGQSVANGATDVLKYTTKYTDGSFNRHKGDYDTTTGVYTVPLEGAKHLHIAATAYAASGTPGGEFLIFQGASPSVEGNISGLAMNVAADYLDVAAGTTFTIKFHNTSGGAVAFGTTDMDRITISIEN